MPHQCTNCNRHFPDGSTEMLTGCPDCGGNKFQFAPTMAALDGSSPSPPAGTTGASAGNPPGDPSTGTADSDQGESPHTRPSLDDQTRADTTDRTGQTSASSTASTRQPSSSAASPRQTPCSPGSPQRRSSPSESRVRGRDDEFEWVGGEEDDAQASARTDVVTPDELPDPPDRRLPADDSLSSGDGETPPAPGHAQSRPHSSQASSTSESGNSTTPPSGNGTDEHVGPADQSGSVDQPSSTGDQTDESGPRQPTIEELSAELNDQFESIKIVRPGEYELNLMELYNREEHIVSLQEDGRYVIDVPDTWRESE